MIITGTLKNIAKVVDVAKFSKRCKCCSAFKMLQMLQYFKNKMWQVLQGFSKEKCCGDVNKRCKCARFPKT